MKILLTAALALALPAVAAGQDDVREALQGLGYVGTDEEAVDPAEALLEEFHAAHETWRADVKAARKVDKERYRALKDADPTKEYWAKFEALDAAGSPRALAWMFFQADELGEKKKATTAHKSALFERLLATCASEPFVGEHLADLSREKRWIGEEGVREAYATIYERNSDFEVSGEAGWKLASRLILSKATAEERARGIALLEELSAEEELGEISERAADALYLATKLAIGCEAPNFESVDRDGETFQLSDYRGQVVVLDFWGFW